MEPVLPQELQQVDFARVRFVLEFQETCSLDAARFLGLRSQLNSVAKRFYAEQDAVGRRRYKALFDPEAGSDPVAVRKFQKPAPPFVVLLAPFAPYTADAGDCFALELLFLGTSIPLIGDFLSVLSQLGRAGLNESSGRFVVVEAFASGEDDVSQSIWRADVPVESIAPPLDTLGSWIERQDPHSGLLSLTFNTPTRLLSGGRLLRRPDFVQLFPFMLRRVTSMLYAHADCEPWVDIDALFQMAREVEVCRRSFLWQDWKELGRNRSIRQIGGFTGTLCLDGDALGEIFWVIAAAGLLGVGKGAAYGAGRFRLTAGEC